MRIHIHYYIQKSVSHGARSTMPPSNRPPRYISISKSGTCRNANIHSTSKHASPGTHSKDEGPSTSALLCFFHKIPRADPFSYFIRSTKTHSLQEAPRGATSFHRPLTWHFLPNSLSLEGCHIFFRSLLRAHSTRAQKKRATSHANVGVG